MAAWTKDYPTSTLLFRDEDNRLLIEDRRAGWEPRTIIIEGDIPLAAYRLLDHEHSFERLFRGLAKAGLAVSSKELRDLLIGWRGDGLVYEDEDHWVALATHATTLRLRSSATPVTTLDPARTVNLAQGLWPSDADLAQMKSTGIFDLVANGEIRIESAAAEASLSFLRFLRDASSRLLHVRWQGSFDAWSETFTYLAAPGVDAWDGRHYGTYYWRQGPDFVLVTDRRYGQYHQFELDGEQRRLFLRLMEVTRLLDLTPADRVIAANLTELGLVLRLSDYLLTLPTRMRHWPQMTKEAL